MKKLMILLIVLGLAGSAWALTETFDTDLGNWADLASQNTDGDNNFIWQNSINAGGSAGEAGGAFGRHTWSYIGDDLGVTLTSSDTIEMSGKLYLDEGDGGGPIWLGFFNTSSFQLGLQITEPDSSGIGDPFRVYLSNGDIEEGTMYEVAQDTAVTFDLTYNGSGTLSGTLAGQAVSRSISPGSITAMGMGTMKDSTSADQYNYMYVDDVTYTPEPATIALLGMGSLVLLRRRK